MYLVHLFAILIFFYTHSSLLYTVVPSDGVSVAAGTRKNREPYFLTIPHIYQCTYNCPLNLIDKNVATKVSLKCKRAKATVANFLIDDF